MNASVQSLKQQLEQLFPGKWLTGGAGDKILRTGIRDIDSGIASGFARRRISQWAGPSSSGKSTLLRGAIAYWCASGLNVAYVDTFSRLVAQDWAFVKEGHCGAVTLNMLQRKTSAKGEFFVVRISDALAEQQENCHAGYVSKNCATGASRKDTMARPEKKDIRQEACWAVEQLIRSAVFDAIIFDMAEIADLSDRVYARLSRALTRSKAALIILRDLRGGCQGGAGNDITGSGWGCHISMHFKWSAAAHFENGVHGISLIVPAIDGIISRDGLTQSIKTRLTAHVQNRLFTHPRIPDRRAPKARERA